MNKLSFLTLIWLFPLAFAIHEMEEWNIMAWYRRNYVDLPDKTDKSTRSFLVFASLLGFLWTLIAYLPGSPIFAALWMLPLMALTLQNILQHIWWLFLFKEYAPGVGSAVFLLLPLIVYLTCQALKKGYAPLWYVLLLALLTLPGLVQTIQSRNRLTPMFQLLHRFGKALSRLV
ncbi:HXXEE domain-containing protein [Chloroflexota bacterium]